jgi:hypothetical protein
MAGSHDLGLAVGSSGRQLILPYAAIQTDHDSRHARSFRVHRAAASRVASDTRRNRPPGRGIAVKKLTLS